ncbi:hypothetical protein JHK87_005802 [Glycine soja]|nr:hypothetical protein JHK87_005802 [Glycine soja]
MGLIFLKKEKERIEETAKKQQQTSTLIIDAIATRKIPDTFLGAFFEEINHAGAGGLWAELVRNRGFEAGGSNVPSNIYPWSIIGDDSTILVSTDRTSSFERNKVALSMKVLCNESNPCPSGGVGISNPGYWGMGHGFRKDLFQMVADLKPKFFRFPGGCYVEGDYLRNAFRWKDTVGPWEERPGHYGDVWNYWSDDGFGFFEGLQEALDGIEFARGSPESRWGSLRASMGHPKPFDLRIVAIGNEDCDKFNYKGNYLKFYDAIRRVYPDIQIISNCDGSENPLDHPADLYDFHAFVSEYAVWQDDAGNGTLLAAVAEAAFLIGLEKNRWTPDAIAFDSYRHYETPSYWVQCLFIPSSGATLLNSTLLSSSNKSLAASAIEYTNPANKKNYLRIKVVNFGDHTENLRIFVNGLDSKVQQSGSTKIVLTAPNVREENSFSEPKKIVPQHTSLEAAKQTSTLIVDAKGSVRKIPDTFFGAFFEEINHAGAGGLWAELVRNRGFEAGGPNVPSDIYPWSIIGDDSTILVSTDRSSCFERNKIALRMNVLCNQSNPCPAGGVGISNPGFWGMNIEKGQKYKAVFYVKARGGLDLDVSFVGSERGGCYVEGNYLRNAFRWKDTVGPWEERPGHFNDVWNYWTDDGFGFFEGLQEALDGIEFARGSPKSQWGSLRASMGHPEPFDLRIVAIGNEECGMSKYQANYLKFHTAIKQAYPDIQIITNCDGSEKPLDHPADLYDFHAFVSEYAVWKDDAGNGTLLAAVAEAAFLIGLERNSDVVHMVSYAPLFVNTNDRRWTPDAIVFDSHQHYGTPSYWVQHLFSASSGATLLNTTLQNSTDSLVASAIEYTNPEDKKNYLRIKVVNFGSDPQNFRFFISGLASNVQRSGAAKTVLTGPNVKEENSFSEPKRVAPQHTSLEVAHGDMNVVLSPYSVTSFDILK